ncbi:hypothetical protein SRABI128_05868 [Microbacterium sp. Bi128]|nr:hypothetical protein SRABI128_05868 [Microbacterium sp. Bi128]
MTGMTMMMTFTGRMAGKTTWKKVWTALAPSIWAASRRVGSTPLSPARYRIMT